MTLLKFIHIFVLVTCVLYFVTTTCWSTGNNNRQRRDIINHPHGAQQPLSPTSGDGDSIVYHPGSFATTTTATSGALFQMTRRRFYTPPSEEENAQQAAATPVVLQTNYPRNSRWAVVTTIFKPTKTVLQLLKMQGWCTVVVADQKSPETYEGPSGSCLVYLTPKLQQSLPYSILRHIPWNTFGRKNVGYLFAMHHGAAVIYDTDDDNEISSPADLQRFTSSAFSYTREYRVPVQTTIVNPYSFFGEPTMWPRGFPLDLIRKSVSMSQWTFSSSLSSSCSIIQSLANTEPDVDAIYRLVPLKYPVEMQTTGTPLLIPLSAMSPFNAQATLFFREAFHLMMLPISVHGRVSDIWRSYFAQHVLRSNTSRNSGDCAFAFAPPWVEQKRNAHTYMADFDAEIPLYLQASALVEYLAHHSNHSTLLETVVDMYEHSILELSDVELAAAWQKDVATLLTLPYHDPEADAHDADNNIGCRKSFSNIYLVQGRIVDMERWLVLMEQLPDSYLVYGAFDASPDCSGRSRALCIHMPGTTWTTGRNQLSKTAAQLEYDHGCKFTYWTFADADVKLFCSEGKDHAACAVDYEQFLMNSNHPIVAIFFTTFRKPGLSNEYEMSKMMPKLAGFDACWNSFHHDALPVLLPYYADLDSNTWYSSQAILWFRVQCFQPFFAVAPLGIFCTNELHSDYPRNSRNLAQEKEVALRNMGNMRGKLPDAPIDFMENEWMYEKAIDIQKIDWQKEHIFQQCLKELPIEPALSFVR